MSASSSNNIDTGCRSGKFYICSIGRSSSETTCWHWLASSIQYPHVITMWPCQCPQFTTQCQCLVSTSSRLAPSRQEVHGAACSTSWTRCVELAHQPSDQVDHSSKDATAQGYCALLGLYLSYVALLSIYWKC